MARKSLFRQFSITFFQDFDQLVQFSFVDFHEDRLVAGRLLLFAIQNQRYNLLTHCGQIVCAQNPSEIPIEGCQQVVVPRVVFAYEKFLDFCSSSRDHIQYGLLEVLIEVSKMGYQF